MSTEKDKKGIVAIFSYLDHVCEAMDKINDRSDFKGHEVFSPTSYHELIERIENKLGPSEVRWFTLLGALTGVTSGFGMCLLMDYDWPITVGGKLAGIYSLPAYVVFGFELMILLGAIFTILGMLFMGRLPNPHAKILDTRITDDKFAIFIPDASMDGEQARLMKDCGAEEVYQTS